jgi:hypothetical protein
MTPPVMLDAPIENFTEGAKIWSPIDIAKVLNVFSIRV